MLATELSLPDTKVRWKYLFDREAVKKTLLARLNSHSQEDRVIEVQAILRGENYNLREART